jgi:hypothetical protein
MISGAERGHLSDASPWAARRFASGYAVPSPSLAAARGAMIYRKVDQSTVKQVGSCNPFVGREDQ